MEDGKFKIILLLVVWESYRNYLCVVGGVGTLCNFTIFHVSPLNQSLKCFARGNSKFTIMAGKLEILHIFLSVEYYSYNKKILKLKGGRG